MYGDTEDNADESSGEYGRHLRDRALDSMRGVWHMLETGPNIHHPPRRKPKRYRSDGNFEHSDHSYGAAKERLREMLHKQELRTLPRTLQFSKMRSSPGFYEPDHQFSASVPPRGPPPGPRGEIPTPEETVPLLQNQTLLVQQLEAENKACQDEVHVLKQKVREVVEENKVLHEELKTSVVQELLEHGLELPGIPSANMEAMVSASGKEVPSRPMGKQDFSKWKNELERLTSLHTAKTSRLEAQLSHAKEEVEKCEKQIETLRSKVRMQESLGAVDKGLVGLTAGLCIRCGQNEAILPATTSNQKQQLERITRERDDLVEQLTSLRRNYESLRHREEDAYQQVKKSVELVEQAQLEQTQALVQREQLKEELENMRSRMGEHVEDMTRKMQQERNIVRSENSAERNELNEKIKELTESFVATQGQLDRVTRDKVTLLSELEAYKGQVTTYDVDYGKATDTMKLSMTQATMERNTALQDLHKLKMEHSRETKDKEQEVHRIKVESENLRRRMNKAEKELVEAKEECVRMHTTMQQVERECHLAKLARESIEKTRNDDLKSVTRRSEQREEELNRLIEQLERKHGETISEMEEIMNSQTHLVQKLREECRRTTGQLENVSGKYKSENKRLKNENTQFKMRYEKSNKRLNELEEQHVQHGLLQDKMRERLKQMDSHAQHGARQMIEMLNKESRMLRDRQLLAQEVEFLRRQYGPSDSALPNHDSAQKGLIDSILEKIRQGEDLEPHKHLNDLVNPDLTDPIAGLN